MGKPVAQSLAEVEKCAWACDYYADNAAGFLAPEIVATDARKSYVSCQPLGVVFGIMPWNFPFWQAFRTAIPSMLAGNTFLLKPAPGVPGCGRAVLEIFRAAGFDSSFFAGAFIPDEICAQVIACPEVRVVAFTGSVRGGRAVAEAAGRALKKTLLELGGSDAYVILRDAPLETAAKACALSRMIGNGQSCIAAKRFIVEEAIADAFESLLTAEMKSFQMGDPLDPRVTLGPLARADLRGLLDDQVRESLRAGARLLLGGAIPQGAGWFYPPTVLTGVKPGMRAFDEELFGPVAAVIRARDADEAVALANQSSYGLGAAVFTADAARGEVMAREMLDAGLCFVNSHVRSDPRLPFGGVKNSGYGRELGFWGIREFVNLKTVYVA